MTEQESLRADHDALLRAADLLSQASSHLIGYQEPASGAALRLRLDADQLRLRTMAAKIGPRLQFAGSAGEKHGT